MNISGGTMLFEQEGNCCDGGDEFLEVQIKDGGGGKFIVFKTEQWAATKNDILEIFDKVEAAFGFTTED